MDLTPQFHGVPLLFAIRHVYQPRDAGLYVFVSHRANGRMSHDEATLATGTNIMCQAPPNSCRSWVRQEYTVGPDELHTEKGLLWTIDIYLYDVELGEQAETTTATENAEEYSVQFTH